MHYLCIFLICFCSKIIFDQKVFSFCWGKLDYPRSIVYLSCLTFIYCLIFRFLRPSSQRHALLMKSCRIYATKTIMKVRWNYDPSLKSNILWQAPYLFHYVYEDGESLESLMIYTLIFYKNELCKNVEPGFCLKSKSIQRMFRGSNSNQHWIFFIY